MKIKNDAGEEIEVFSPEEAEALAKEKAEAARQEALDAAAVVKEELEKKLKGYEDKDYNFQQLRNKKEKDSEELTALKTKLDEVTGKVSQLEVQPFEKAKSDFMSTNGIEGDKELKEKFEFFYKSLSGSVKSEADHKAALAGALGAATGGSRQPSFEGVMVSTRVTPPSSNNGAVSEVSKNIAASLNITEEDRKKYGKKR